jgi:hypothetical protein
MSTMKCLGFALGIALAASSFAIAQQSNPDQQSNPTNNPAASGTQQGNPTNNTAATGSGTHQATQKTGRARSTAKHRVATHPVTGRRIYALQLPSGCHLVRVGNNLFRRICR